jgi:ATP-dependent RNA helicase DDX10/DBP4
MRPRLDKKAKRSDAEKLEVEALERQVREGAPQSGTDGGQRNADASGYAGSSTFVELPLSAHTLKALEEHKFVRLTAIQRASLPHALCGRDILGAAKTGSGKTLCFLVPVRPCATQCAHC